MDFAAGAITADAISDELGEGVLSSVLSLVGGAAAGVAAGKVLDAIDEETGIVSDIGGLVDDILDIF